MSIWNVNAGVFSPAPGYFWKESCEINKGGLKPFVIKIFKIFYQGAHVKHVVFRGAALNKITDIKMSKLQKISPLPPPPTKLFSLIACKTRL